MTLCLGMPKQVLPSISWGRSGGQPPGQEVFLSSCQSAKHLPAQASLSPQKHSAAADITSSLSDDQVPQAFLVMLLIQFSTMVIDRALYLRKSVLGKLVFQVFLVFGIHVWMFFILPAVTERYLA